MHKHSNQKTTRNIRVPESLVKAIVALVRPYIHGADEETVQQAILAMGKAPQENAPESQELLTRNQVAKMLCVSTRTVDRYLRDGTLQRIDIRGAVRVTPQSVEKIMSAE